MLFTIGIETPTNENEAYGITGQHYLLKNIPALVPLIPLKKSQRR